MGRAGAGRAAAWLAAAGCTGEGHTAAVREDLPGPNAGGTTFVDFAGEDSVPIDKGCCTTL